jgi:malate/lactate dehydrogenase
MMCKSFPDTLLFCCPALTQGVAKVLGVGEIDAFEKAAFDSMLPQLKAEIKKGVDFIHAPPAPVASS